MGGNEEIAIFRLIRGCGCYGSPDGTSIFLKWSFFKASGLYGKRWIIEIVVRSVIKRRFDDYTNIQA